jgi:hypothetical protein
MEHSRELTKLLRHRLHENGLSDVVRADGFVPIDRVLDLAQFSGLTEVQVREIVRADDKQRYSLLEEDGMLYIRANPRHGVEANALVPVAAAEAGETTMTVAAFYEAASNGISFRSHEEQTLRQWLIAVRGALASSRHDYLSPAQFLHLLGTAALADEQGQSVAAAASPGLTDAPLASVVELLDQQVATLGALEAQGVYDNPHRGFGVNAAVDSEGESEHWCNFGTAGYVECACAGGFAAGVDDEDAEAMPMRLSADALVGFFECGRSYE